MKRGGEGSEESSKANLTARSVTSPGCRWPAGLCTGRFVVH